MRTEGVQTAVPVGRAGRQGKGWRQRSLRCRAEIGHSHQRGLRVRRFAVEFWLSFIRSHKISQDLTRFQSISIDFELVLVRSEDFDVEVTMMSLFDPDCVAANFGSLDASLEAIRLWRKIHVHQMKHGLSGSLEMALKGSRLWISVSLERNFIGFHGISLDFIGFQMFLCIFGRVFLVLWGPQPSGQ